MAAIFKIPGYLIYFISGIWGFFLSLEIVVDNLGFLGGAIAFFLAPVTLVFAPWYEAIANSDWFLIMLVYGGAIAATVLFAIGSALDGD